MVPSSEDCVMTGISSHPTGTLIDHAVRLLNESPRSATELTTTVMGLPGAPPSVAERLALALLGADPRVCQRADGAWALVKESRRLPSLDECAFAVVDVETTGLSPDGADRITEIAAAVVQGGRCELVFESLVNPGRLIPARIVELTGISQRDVDGAPGFGQVADQLLGALEGRVFVAHNASFDWGFVRAELRRARSIELNGPRLCTVRLSRRLFRGERSYGLGALAERFGLELSSRHRAAGDALVAAKLLSRLLDAARERGANTLDDLDKLQRTPLRELESWAE